MACGLDLEFRPTLTAEQYAMLSSSASPVRKAVAVVESAARSALGVATHDLLLIHRLRLLSPLPGVDPPRHLDAYDLDDALFLGSPADNNRHYQWAKQEARRCVACMRRARLVIAGNAYLAAHAKEHAAWVEVIPTCIDPERQPLRRHRAAEVVTVGWIGSHTTSAYLKPILPVLARLNRDRIVARLVIVGANGGVREAWTEHRAWSLEEEPDLLASFDIGLMPMPATEWARGKCGYKLLQYFSAGVPAIASPVGVAPELLADGRGLTATTPEEWHTVLAGLIADADERRERGTAARAYVEREYSYQRWAPELGALLKSLAV